MGDKNYKRVGKQLPCSCCSTPTPVAMLHRCWCGATQVCMACQRDGKHERCIDRKPARTVTPVKAPRLLLSSVPQYRTKRREELTLEEYLRIAEKFKPEKATVINW